MQEQRLNALDNMSIYKMSWTFFLFVLKKKMESMQS